MEAAKLNLTLGNAQREFHFRKGTVDEGVVVQVLQTGAFDHGRLRRGAELDALYEQLVASGKMPLIVDASAGIGAAVVFFNYKFPKARVMAFEPDAAKFQLLSANTAGLPVECVQTALAAEHGAGAATVNELYERCAQDAAPFIVKVDVEADDSQMFAANTEWVERTPIIMAALGDYLIPGTARSRAFVEFMIGRNRDFFYVQDNIFSISREPSLLQAAQT